MKEEVIRSFKNKFSFIFDELLDEFPEQKHEADLAMFTEKMVRNWKEVCVSICLENAKKSSDELFSSPLYIQMVTFEEYLKYSQRLIEKYQGLR